LRAAAAAGLVPTRRSLLARAAAAAGIGSLAGCVAPPVSGTDYGPPDGTATATFRRGLKRHGYAAARIPDAVTPAWSLAVNPGDHTAAKASAVRDGRGNYLVPGDDGLLRSVTPGGAVNWEAATEPSSRGIHGTPTVANGLAYVGAYDGGLYAFDLATGDRVWRRSLGGSIGSSPGYRDGTAYIAVEFPAPDGSMAAVDALSGLVEWTDDAPTDHPHSTVGIDADRGLMAVGSNDGVLYGWSWPDHERAWTFRTDGAIKGPVAIYDGAAFFGSWDRGVYRVDLADGTEDWRVETDGKVMSGPGVHPGDGVVYVGSHDGDLRAIDAADGTVAWSFPTGGRITGCPAVTDDRVAFGSYDGRAYALDRSDGSEVWSVDLGAGHVTASPLVVEDGVLIAARRSAPGDPGPAVLLAAD